jgi:uncharacterized protein YgiM (DUF1202 family)
MILPIILGVILVGGVVYFLSKNKNIAINDDNDDNDDDELTGGNTGGGTIGGGTTGGTTSFIVKTKSGTRLRSEPSTSSTIIKTYSAGYEMKVVGNSTQSDGIWYKVIDPNTLQSGYMRSDVVEI